MLFPCRGTPPCGKLNRDLGQNLEENRVSDPGTTGKHILLTAVGSLGDLYPYLAIGLGLRARGHDAIIATSECYRRNVEGVGLGFRALRPDSVSVADPEVMCRFMDLRRGTERVRGNGYCPSCGNRTRTHELRLNEPTCWSRTRSRSPPSWSPRTRARREHRRWSARPGSSPPSRPPVARLPRALESDADVRPGFLGPDGPLAQASHSLLGQTLASLCGEIGLPPTSELNPLVDGQAPVLHLALFSCWLASKQADWPPQTTITGFPFHDRDSEAVRPRTWLNFSTTARRPSSSPWDHRRPRSPDRSTGSAPLPQGGWGGRAVLILGDPRTRPRSLPKGVAAFDYAPFSILFPRAAAVVFPGGIGMTGLAMHRAGQCWWYRTPMTSPTRLTVSPGWGSLAPSTDIATPRSVLQRGSAGCSTTRRFPGGHTTSARGAGGKTELPPLARLSKPCWHPLAGRNSSRAGQTTSRPDRHSSIMDQEHRPSTTLTEEPEQLGMERGRIAHVRSVAATGDDDLAAHLRGGGQQVGLLLRDQRVVLAPDRQNRGRIFASRSA